MPSTLLEGTPDVRAAAPPDREAALHVLTLAFGADPAIRFMYPEAGHHVEHFRAFADAFGGRAFEAGTACVTADFSGASLWYPPGVHPDGDAIEAVTRDTVHAPHQEDLNPVLDEMDRYHPEEPHWYLAIIGVDPARQGRGTGAALLRHTLATVDEQGMPAYLESSNPANITLYERHGFEVVGRIQHGDFPVVTPMYRPAR